MQPFTYYLETIGEIGFIEEAVPSIVYASGLPGAKLQEIILFESGEFGQVLSLTETLVEILVFSKFPARAGTRVVRTGQIIDMPVGKEYFGQTIDPLGDPLDRLKQLPKPTQTRPIDISPRSIRNRRRIKRPLETGVTLVDMLIPLGTGQRELVIGDRKTGKTTFVYQTILSQAKLGTLCIYAAIGKKRMDIKRAEEFFIKNGIMNQVIIVASTSEDAPGVIYLTPYSAMSLAEYFRDQGRDVLLVLDDLFTHARFYREISLMGRRFPGRNSYPADIFYTHARLLERAGNYAIGDTEKSITCMPVVETVQGDLSGYIQTNLMSMTDGHIYFDIDIFGKGRRPAINPFLSVSRVGRQTQTPLERSIQRELISFLTLRDKVENFAHFGSEANATIKVTLATGERIFAFFEQASHEVISQPIQVFIFGLLWMGYWNEKPLEQLKRDIRFLISQYQRDKTFSEFVVATIEKPDSLNALLTVLRQNTQHIEQISGLIQIKSPAQPVPTHAPIIQPKTESNSI